MGLTMGGEVAIKATVIAPFQSDRVDFFMASTTPGPNTVWTPIGTTLPNPPGVALKEVSIVTNLRPGLSLQAVRVIIRFAAGNLIGEPCPTGGGATFTDTDDLVFEVAMSSSSGGKLGLAPLPVDSI